ncbi:cytochrome c oxidase subunit 5b-1, mitochondrial-like [Cucurbita moschata]|uniref:Cytochrome c oxidase subunit 5b-1, mitochondrial-like n=1 Tax=Cucurbita moschata TaxID=3662 RepID=A0A6J1GC67_CUCMO|nr:cytochrome c oxidase subunit 5b-1, mitochondrial-like [Cucurbita moschata]
MWRKFLFSQLRALKSFPSTSAAASAPLGFISRASRLTVAASSHVFPSPHVSFYARHYGAEAVDAGLKKKVEDVMPIATGHEREELEAALEGRDILDIDNPVGPFGTKEDPAVIKSYYDERLVGCPGGEGEDEHDVVWFRLKKGEPHECPVCTQYFVLEVVGPGGSPDGFGNEDDHHH